MTVGIGACVPKSLVRASFFVGILARYLVGSTTFTPSSVPSRLPDLPTLPPATYCTQYLADGKQLLVTKTAATCPILSESTTTSASTEVATYNPAGASSLGDVDPSDDECNAFRERVVMYGVVTWRPVEQSVEVNECDQYCHAKWDDAVAHGKVASAGCMLDDPVAWTEFNSTWQAAKGKCLCNVPVIDTIIEDFVKSLPAVAEITCKVWYTAISSVLEVGLNALPGVGQAVGAALTLAYQAAQVAAYTYEDQQDAASAFTTWAQNPSSQHMASGSSTWGMDKLCGNKYTPPQAEKIFGDFSLASGSIGIPKLWAGALRAWPPPYPKGSGSLDEMLGYIDGLGGKPRPRGERPGHDDDPDHDPHNSKVPKSHPLTTGHPQSEHRSDSPTKTKSHQSSRVSSDKACTRHGKRMQGNKKDDCKVTITSVQASVPAKNPETIKKKCDFKAWPQACAHYYSAIYANPKKPGKSQFICDERNNARIPQKYTEYWTNQHHKVWREFTTSSYMFRGEQKELKCDADEYPPAYFVPRGRDGSTEWGQRVRWIPRGDNRGVASLWNSFCAAHDGGFLNGQREGRLETDDTDDDGNFIGNLKSYEARKLNAKLVDFQNAKSKLRKGPGGTMTWFYDKVTFSQPVFELEFDWGGSPKPSKENNWYLEENPCWPRDIAADDPGFCLPVNDPWYQGHPKLNAKQYKIPPDWDLFDQANQLRKQQKMKLIGEKGMPPRKDASSGTSGGNSRSGSRRKRLELIDDRIHLRDDLYNTTRPLTDEELSHNVEVTHCADRRCSREQEEVAANQDDSLIIPGVGPPSKPSTNVAVPTLVTKTLPPEFVRRGSLSPDLPLVTAANGMQD